MTLQENIHFSSRFINVGSAFCFHFSCMSCLHLKLLRIPFACSFFPLLLCTTACSIPFYWRCSFQQICKLNFLLIVLNGIHVGCISIAIILLCLYTFYKQSRKKHMLFELGWVFLFLSLTYTYKFC